MSALTDLVAGVVLYEYSKKVAERSTLADFKRRRRIAAIIVLVVLLCAFAFGLLLAAVAGASPNYCTPSYPWPRTSQEVCTTMSGTSCNLWLDGCSAQPGVPGTWNPRGYTPCLRSNGCDPAYPGSRIP